MIVIYIWFGIGTFLAICSFIQWCLEGCLIAEGDDPRDRFYYLYGMLQNVFFSFLLGPILLVVHIMSGAPILPYKRG